MGLPGRPEKSLAECGRTGRVLPSGIGAVPFKEEMMPGSRSKDESTRVPLHRTFGGRFRGLPDGGDACRGAARAESANAIRQFASANFGWQSNLRIGRICHPGQATVRSRTTRPILS